MSALREPSPLRMPGHLSIRITLATLAVALSSGCALVGTVKPMDQKSQDYGVIDLSKANPDWVKLNPAQAGDGKIDKDPSTQPTEIADAAFQSKSTSSVISINSACGPEARQNTLQEDSRELLLGITDVTLRNEKDLTIQGHPALETTIRGELNDESVMIRADVIHKANCVYDLMYIARPDRFEAQVADFSRFVGSLHLK